MWRAAGKIRNQMEASQWENHRTNFYLVMFDYRSAPNNKWEFVVDIADFWRPSSLSSSKKMVTSVLTLVDICGYHKLAHWCYKANYHPSHNGNPNLMTTWPSLDWRLLTDNVVVDVINTVMGILFKTIIYNCLYLAFVADWMGYSCGYDGLRVCVYIYIYIYINAMGCHGQIMAVS